MALFDTDPRTQMLLDSLRKKQESEALAARAKRFDQPQHGSTTHTAATGAFPGMDQVNYGGILANAFNTYMGGKKEQESVDAEKARQEALYQVLGRPQPSPEQTAQQDQAYNNGTFGQPATTQSVQQDALRVGTTPSGAPINSQMAGAVPDMTPEEIAALTQQYTGDSSRSKPDGQVPYVGAQQAPYAGQQAPRQFDEMERIALSQLGIDTSLLKDPNASTSLGNTPIYLSNGQDTIIGRMTPQGLVNAQNMAPVGPEWQPSLNPYQQVREDISHQGQMAYTKDLQGAMGKGVGDKAVAMPQIRAQVSQLNAKADQLLGNTKALEALETMWGNAKGIIPKTEQHAFMNDLRGLASQARLAAFLSMKGAGQITEAESLFGANAQGNLDAMTNPTQLISEIKRMRAAANDGLQAAEAVAAGNLQAVPAPTGETALQRFKRENP